MAIIEEITEEERKEAEGPLEDPAPKDADSDAKGLRDAFGYLLKGMAIEYERFRFALEDVGKVDPEYKPLEDIPEEDLSPLAKQIKALHVYLNELDHALDAMWEEIYKKLDESPDDIDKIEGVQCPINKFQEKVNTTREAMWACKLLTPFSGLEDASQDEIIKKIDDTLVTVLEYMLFTDFVLREGKTAIEELKLPL